jgi:hypothetical protein
MIKVVNKSKHFISSKEDVYVGRGSILGNPYTGSKDIINTKALFQCNSREEAIEKYKEYLLNEINNKNTQICDELNRIYLKAKNGNVNLVCYCAPLFCHGDFIKELIEIKLIKNTLKP